MNTGLEIGVNRLKRFLSTMPKAKHSKSKLKAVHVVDSSISVESIDLKDLNISRAKESPERASQKRPKLSEVTMSSRPRRQKKDDWKSKLHLPVCNIQPIDLWPKVRKFLNEVELIQGESFKMTQTGRVIRLHKLVKGVPDLTNFIQTVHESLEEDKAAISSTFQVLQK